MATDIRRGAGNRIPEVGKVGAGSPITDTDFYVVALRLSPRARDRASYFLWYEETAERNAALVVDGRLWWRASASTARRWAATNLHPSNSVSREPAGRCDVAELLTACARPHDRYNDLLATIDTLDDIRQTADVVNESILDAEGALQARKVHDAVRNALFDGNSWAQALEAAGGGEAVAAATLDAVGRIAAASRTFG